MKRAGTSTEGAFVIPAFCFCIHFLCSFLAYFYVPPPQLISSFLVHAWQEKVLLSFFLEKTLKGRKARLGEPFF